MLDSDQDEGFLRDEPSVLQFARHFLIAISSTDLEVIAPSQVKLHLSSEGLLERLEISSSTVAAAGSIYRTPSWMPPDERWRIQLGFLMRFILAAQADFTRRVPRASTPKRKPSYRPAESHWYQRLYGFFNQQLAFGNDWLPISDWLERFLSALLHWPGCRELDEFRCISQGWEATLAVIVTRLDTLAQCQGHSDGTVFIPITVRRPTEDRGNRPMRACIVQSAVPAAADFTSADLTLSNPAMRKRHRRHLSACLAALRQMLALRETHRGSDGRLDWIILPELSVHPDDVATHLVPFARASRAMILAGVTYEEILPGKPLVNSAIWIIPEWSSAHGLQIRTRRQGKRHLSPAEKTFNNPTALLQGFRPCQWLIGYPWASGQDPMWLTSAVCYDATDLTLISDLRKRSRVCNTSPK